MAHKNINERRTYVKTLLNSGKEINFEMKVDIGKKFGCSHSAITADINALTRDKSRPTPHVSKKMRAKVHARDAQICQYCGQKIKKRESEVEHIIPYSDARLYNLVLSCKKCNAKKGNSVWKPNNLDAITMKHPRWKQKILNRADPDQPRDTLKPTEDPIELAKENRLRIKKFEQQWEINKARKRVESLINKAFMETQKFPSIVSDEWSNKLKTLLDELDKSNKGV